MTASDEQVVIWSGEHSAYWRSNAAGYTNDHSQAGRYARAEAERLTGGCGPEKLITIIPVENLPSREIDRLRAELAAEREKRERAERDRDDWHENWRVLEKAVLGDSAGSAIMTAGGLRERADRAEAACADYRRLFRKIPALPRDYTSPEVFDRAVNEIVADALSMDADRGRDEPGEHCQACGRHYLTIYRVPNEVWADIAPDKGTLGPYSEHQYGGLLCVGCAASRAREVGIELYFEATVGGWPDEGGVTPHWTDEAREFLDQHRDRMPQASIDMIERFLSAGRGVVGHNDMQTLQPCPKCDAPLTIEGGRIKRSTFFDPEPGDQQ